MNAQPLLKSKYVVSALKIMSMGIVTLVISSGIVWMAIVRLQDSLRFDVLS